MLNTLYEIEVAKLVVPKEWQFHRWKRHEAHAKKLLV